MLVLKESDCIMRKNRIVLLASYGSGRPQAFNLLALWLYGSMAL
jgi:hypothetical protein